MDITIRLEGTTEELIKRICKLSKTTPDKFLTDFLQDSTMIKEFLEETVEDLEGES